ncbi:hypothetical protein J4232_04535 [Candidatus Woesearchaeota archaeon]|nr:hypothetical protein [Candidatus Woesearchaeota archaeon]
MEIIVSLTNDVKQFVHVAEEIFKDISSYNYYKDEESIQKFFSSKNPFWQHAEYKLFIAMQDNQAVGRMAVIIDSAYNKENFAKQNFLKPGNQNNWDFGGKLRKLNFAEFSNQKTAFFGFFEVENNFVITKLFFREALRYLKKKKIRKLIGPIDGNMFNNVGLLQNNFSLLPEMYMPTNPAYYLEHLEKLKMKKHIDILAYTIYLPNYQAQQNKNPDIRIVKFNKKEFDTKIKAVFDIYSEAYGKTKHWLYYPLSFEEFYYQVKDLKEVLDGELTLVLYYKNAPVGFVYCIPNYNLIADKITAKSKFFQMLQFLWYKQTIKEARLILICILPNDEHKRFGTILANKLLLNLKKKGFTNCEYSWVLETNTASRHLAEKLSGKVKNLYRVYEMNL